MSSVKEISDSAFETEVIDQEQPVLAYFWAPWCGPCRLVSPTIDWAGNNYSDRLKIVKLEIDKNQASVSRCQVEGVPALRLFKNQQVVASHEGAITKQQLQTLLESHL
ncbi:co-chaperone YbbN [Gloeocapsa sp. PCC 73106]|uniref:thioredoxin family protein n=1 Tax=Gloeocapsa sp. PCC 73106 TaxID=102232 RepID=UPI0002AC3440|nr:thioredoxin family protein [Gloeocapsa sp. PCC 73106]ELR96572.1 thioredoxin domain-containing protein [Gloeocapsa sp. PCC 73106]